MARACCLLVLSLRIGCVPASRPEVEVDSACVTGNSDSSTCATPSAQHLATADDEAGKIVTSMLQVKFADEPATGKATAAASDAASTAGDTVSKTSITLDDASNKIDSVDKPNVPKVSSTDEKSESVDSVDKHVSLAPSTVDDASDKVDSADSADTPHDGHEVPKVSSTDTPVDSGDTVNDSGDVNVTETPSKSNVVILDAPFVPDFLHVIDFDNLTKEQTIFFAGILALALFSCFCACCCCCELVCARRPKPRSHG